MDRLAELGSNKVISKVSVVPLPHSGPRLKAPTGLAWMWWRSHTPPAET